MKIRSRLSSALVCVALMLFTLNTVQAIPAFTRKYETSCVTCHMSFPRLTPFGEFFRINGFRMLEMEEESIKEDAVSLGSEAYKQVWPDAIWPGSIPGTTPVSLRIRSGFTYSKVDEVEFAEFTQPALQIMTGGTFSDNISFFVGAHLFEHGEAGSLDRVYLKLDDMFSNILPKRALFLRIGQFIPDISSIITNHRSLTQTAYAFNTYAPSSGSTFGAGHIHGAAAFGLESFQLGAEASGLFTSRSRYVLGVVNGNGVDEDNNSAKDFYGKLSYKVGGMAFDGSTEGDIYGGSAKNWAEKSLTLSGFSYLGTSVSSNKDVDIRRYGVDVKLFMRDLNIHSGFITGSDEEYEGTNLHKAKYSLFCFESSYMIFPWMTGLLRYERAELEGNYTMQRFIPHLTALYTANIKFLIETRINPDDPEFNYLSIGMDFAY